MVTADALLRSTLSLRDDALRATQLARVLEDGTTGGAEVIADLARALEDLCERAEQAEEPARLVLVALVDAIHRPEVSEAVQRLREEAAAGGLLALERLVRQPVATSSSLPPRPSTRLPDFGMGRPLTLGERKSLARKPDRHLLERLVADPHPDVIARLLVNPRLTEDDVVRLVSRRPGRPEILTEIARSARWGHSARVRMALVLHPDTPPDVSAPITGLLVRQELRYVATSTRVPASVRALCLERLRRRPPQPEGDPGEGGLQ